MITIDLFLYILAFIFFLLCGFNVPASRVNWMCLGFAALVLSLIL
jgi:hypothetical protein